jgi:hypothetical protein
LAEGVVKDYEAELPSAVACFRDDLGACIAHLRLPISHRRAIRTTNLLERLFVEERRRLKIIPNAFGEKPVLKLMFGAMIRAAERWRANKITTFERRQLDAVRKELDHDYEAKNGLEGNRSAASPQTRSPAGLGLDRRSWRPAGGALGARAMLPASPRAELLLSAEDRHRRRRRDLFSSLLSPGGRCPQRRNAPSSLVEEGDGRLFLTWTGTSRCRRRRRCCPRTCRSRPSCCRMRERRCRKSAAAEPP